MKKLRITNCPLCSIFDNKEIITKLHYPESVDNLEDEEFVIVDCKSCKVPMVVYGEHVMSVTREAWGRVLYRCRKVFGKNVKLKAHMRTCRDHIHWHIYIDK